MDGKEITNRETKAKTFDGWLKGCINIARKDKNYELISLYEDMLLKYSEFNPTIIAEVKLDKWKGKDKIQFIEKDITFEIVNHQRPNQDEAPVKFIKIITKEEINNVISAVNNCIKKKDKQGNEFCETPSIANEFCLITGLRQNRKGRDLYPDGKFEWQVYFGDRYLHTNLNLCLRLLDHYKVTRYRGKRTWILNNKFKFQIKL